MKQNICSYCRENGHYINACKNPNIHILHNTLINDSVIDLYCHYKFNFDFLLYKLNLLSIPELRVLGYRNIYMRKLSNNPNKQQIQAYISYLINNVYSYRFKCEIDIPYINNLSSWDYAETIFRLVDKSSVLSIYCDIIQISPRPRCYDDISISLSHKKTESFSYNEHNCSICFNNILDSNSCLLNCNHEFCSICIKKYLNSLYKKTDDNTEFCIPDCPLCRTNISNIILKDENTYVYFLETFHNQFTPSYFNSITTNNITYNHVYEETYYYQYVLNFDSDSDSDIDYGMSPYSLRLPVRVPLDFINNFIRFIFQIRIISRWVFFIGCIYLMNFLYNYNNIKYVYEYDDDIDIDISL